MRMNADASNMGLETDSDSGNKTYAYDPHLDPVLVRAGKAEHTSFEVPTVSLHVHESIDPAPYRRGAVRKRNGAGKQRSLFEFTEENPPLREAVEFYRHRHNYYNSLIVKLMNDAYFSIRKATLYIKSDSSI